MVVDPDRLEGPGVRGEREVTHRGPLVGGGDPDKIETPSLGNEKSKSHGHILWCELCE
ncbi:hypothetical protein GCM10009681_10700 [Luedemannella helvata]|uniref:Uncharacterized protein n=1 Tax=Luedemannella helvata TaxID=349315 RepID=A0ABP4W1W0_9ACTN